MPYTTLAYINNYIPKAIESAFGDSAVFDDVETAAAEIANDLTGIDIPVDAADTPKWMHLPMAFLMKKIAASKFISSKSEQLLKEIDCDYERAIELLSDPTNAQTPHDLSFAATGAIEGGEL
jgi:hypothetical protein